MAKHEDLQQRAAECLRLMQSVGDPNNKALLLEIAQTWVKLSEQARSKLAEANDPRVMP
jgi:hypothetical protein